MGASIQTVVTNPRVGPSPRSRERSKPASSPMHESFQERILSAVDVCNNCFALVREQRLKARRNWELSREAYWARDNQRTTVEFAPADTVSEQKGIFCDCGVEGSFERLWADEDVTRDRFKTFIERVITTLETKGLELDRQRVAAYALDAYNERLPPAVVGPQRPDAPNINEALARGVVRGLHDSTTLSEATADRQRVRV